MHAEGHSPCLRVWRRNSAAVCGTSSALAFHAKRLGAVLALCGMVAGMGYIVPIREDDGDDGLLRPTDFAIMVRLRRSGKRPDRNRVYSVAFLAFLVSVGSSVVFWDPMPELGLRTIRANKYRSRRDHRPTGAASTGAR